MYHYRVTKYNPAFRDAAGAFTKQDWTSFIDIGRSFGNGMLTREEYLRVESSYIDTAVSFLAEDGAPMLRAIGVERHANSAGAPVEGSAITEKDLPAICRSILREEFWCKLEADDRFLHFGWDYYMYIGVKSRCEDAISKARTVGLFVEPFDSPYSEASQK